MLGRDEARCRCPRLPDKGLPAHRAHHVAVGTGAPEHAGAHDIALKRKAERRQLGTGTFEQPPRLPLRRAAGLALDAEIDETLAVPVEHPLAHKILLAWPSTWARIVHSAGRWRGASARACAAAGSGLFRK